MLEPLPGLLSTTTGWPSAFPNASLIARATVSAAPAGAKPTTSRIGLAGYAAGCALALQPKAPKASAATRLDIFMAGLLFRMPGYSGRGGHVQDDLADVVPGLHACLGVLQLREVEDLVDMGLDSSGRDVRHHFRDEPRHGSRSLRLIAQFVGHAEQREPLGVQGIQVDVGVQHAVDIPHRGVPAFESQ